MILMLCSSWWHLSSRRGREEVRDLKEVDIEVQDIHPVLTQLLHLWGTWSRLRIPALPDLLRASVHLSLKPDSELHATFMS